MKSRLEILNDYFSGKSTPQDIEDYKNNYMSEEEKHFGKPVFEMTEDEYINYDILVYNNSEGDLTGYDCKICKNKGKIEYRHKFGHRFFVPCQCVTVRNSLARLKNSGLGNLINLYSFENYKTENEWQKIVLDKAKKFIESDGICFVILGQSGAGKSHICTAMSKELMLKGKNLKYMTWINDTIKLKQNKMNPEVYDKIIYELQNVEVLYIDDLFKMLNSEQKPSEADINLALEIINYRYNLSRVSTKRYITIISSEKTIDELIEYNEALAGRINEMTGEWVLTLIGKDKNYRFKENRI